MREPFHIPIITLIVPLSLFGSNAFLGWMEELPSQQERLLIDAAVEEAKSEIDEVGASVAVLAYLSERCGVCNDFKSNYEPALRREFAQAVLFEDLEPKSGMRLPTIVVYSATSTSEKSEVFLGEPSFTKNSGLYSYRSLLQRASIMI